MTEVTYSFTKTAHELLNRALIQRQCNAELQYGKNGKPYLKNDELFFNLSHSDNLSVCAISDVEIGVDCERVAPAKPHVLERIFNELERETAKSDKAFTEIWTKKESVVKYYGGSLWADGKHTAIIFPKNALYHGNLCKANVFTVIVTNDSEEYAVSIATEDEDYVIQQI